MDTDRNLLFGVLALQADLIDNDQFARACGQWATDKDRSLAEILVERGWIVREDREDVEKLLQRKLRKHNGDVRASLAEVTSERVRQSVSGLADPGIRESLLCTTPPVPGPILLAATTAHRPEQQGERYTLSRLHATGGIGRVWLARDTSLGRDVALKELRPERVGSPAVWARFLMEARVTGQLEHPGIVPIYEVGKHADDQPFYTMRFVRGRTLAEAASSYHDRRKRGQARPMELRELLGAFVGVRNAVAYAHARGVLHRDLKPQNVVLGDYGEVIVLDWGLARLMDQEGEDAAPLSVEVGAEGATMQGQVLGTPAYMSPEQAEGRLDLLDARSDIYGLGAVLYEILTSTPPFTGQDTTAVLSRVVHEEAPPPRSLVPGTPSALEAVCLKALSKKPPARYASARELAADVQHWLADEPVSVYREPLATRLARWGRRHRSLVVGTAALLVALVVGLTAGTVLLGQANSRIERERQEANRQRDRADENFHKAQEAVNDYLTTVSESHQLKSSLPGLQPLRQELLRQALKYYQDFVAQHGDDAALKADLAAAYYRLGKTTATIGTRDDALGHLRQALDLYEALARDQPGNFTLQRGLADTYQRMAFVQAEGSRPAAALEAYQQARVIEERLVQERAEDRDLKFDLAEIENGMGSVLQDLDRAEEALRAFERALAIMKPLAAEEVGKTKYRNTLAGIQSNIAELYLSSFQEPAKALRAFQEAAALEEEMARQDPNDLSVQDYLAIHYRGIANAYFYLRQAKPSLQANRRSTAIQEKLARENPRVKRYQSMLAMAHVNLGQSAWVNGKHAEALQELDKAVEVGERGVRNDPKEGEFHFALGQAYSMRSTILDEKQRIMESDADFEKAVAHDRKAVELRPHRMEYHQALGSHYFNRGVKDYRRGQSKEATEAWRQASVVWEAYATAHPNDRGFRIRLSDKYAGMARIAEAFGHPEAALAEWQKVVSLVESLLAGRPNDERLRLKLATVAHQLAALLVRRGRSAEARKPLERSIAVLRASSDNGLLRDPSRRQLALDYLLRATVWNKDGKQSEALRDYQSAQECLETLTKSGRDDWYNLARVRARIAVLLGKDEPTKREDVAARAMEALRRAVGAGYRDARHLAEDPDLESLHARADFQQLVEELKEIPSGEKKPGKK